MVSAILTLRTDEGPSPNAQTVVDQLSGECWALGCRGIEEIDGTLRVAFDDPETAARAAKVLADHVVGPAEPIADPLAGWEAPMETVDAGPFRIRPVGPEVSPDEGARVSLVIEPRRAFGSGSHPSTRVALTLLGDLPAAAVTGRRALDVGSGTGVLAIAAARLGVASVTAIDIDPAAVEAARANAALNGVADRVTVDRVAAEDLGDDRDDVHDLMLVNLTIDGHEAVAPVLTARLGRSGSVIATGVLAGDQETRLERCHPDLVIAARLQVEGWVGLTLTRPDPVGAVDCSGTS